MFCRLQVADSQFVEQVGEGVLPGFQCLGSSLGRDGAGDCIRVFVMSCVWHVMLSVPSSPRDVVSVGSVS